MTCIFCEIIKGTLPAKIIYQDDKVIAFDDIYPKSPIHKLIVPRKHIATLNDLEEEDFYLPSHMINVAKKIAFDLNIAEPGYRVIINCNEEGGQVIYHLHLHLLAGKKIDQDKINDKKILFV